MTTGTATRMECVAATLLLLRHILFMIATKVDGCRDDDDLARYIAATATDAVLMIDNNLFQVCSPEDIDAAIKRLGAILKEDR
jgi:hypothetical protein